MDNNHSYSNTENMEVDNTHLFPVERTDGYYEGGFSKSFLIESTMPWVSYGQAWLSLCSKKTFDRFWFVIFWYELRIKTRMVNVKVNVRPNISFLACPFDSDSHHFLKTLKESWKITWKMDFISLQTQLENKIHISFTRNIIFTRTILIPYKRIRITRIFSPRNTQWLMLTTR